MSISIIFPIEMGGLSIGIVTGKVLSTSFGCSSYSDLNPVEAIKQNLKMLLLTRPGEYVMDASYGIGLPDYLFMQEQEIDLGSLKSQIRSQAEEFMPYMTISDMSISIDSLQPVMNIRIVFFYNELTIPEVFELEVL